MNQYILDTQTNLWLGYDPATDVIVWVTTQDTANKYNDETDLNIQLATLNTEIEPTRYVGRPGDRGGH